MLCRLDERDEILLLLCGTVEHWLDAVMETLLVFLLFEHLGLSVCLKGSVFGITAYFYTSTWVVLCNEVHQQLQRSDLSRTMTTSQILVCLI